ncbi:DUF1003 domain-containing protein [soil metagenome]|nr:DUF1003 domain-containing protein [Actinomycetota bacterium]
MAREDRRVRLDSPVDPRRSFVRRPAYDPDIFGQLSERIARFIGTGRFLVYMTVVVLVWIIWNVPVGPDRAQFDEYPFIFLTLALSLQASYAAPLILLAQNRQEARDRVNMDQDRDANARAHADMQFLAREVAGLRIALGEVATRDYLRSELRSLLGDLQELQDPDSPLDDIQSRSAGEARDAEPGP